MPLGNRLDGFSISKCSLDFSSAFAFGVLGAASVLDGTVRIA